MFEMIRSRLLT